MTGPSKTAPPYLQHPYKAAKAICASGQQNPQQNCPALSCSALWEQLPIVVWIL